jgi:hypothetical protein
MADVTIEYVSGSATGLFEQAREHYGEIWYELAGKRIVGRSTTTDGVLDPSRPCLGARGAELHEQFLAIELHGGELLEARP